MTTSYSATCALSHEIIFGEQPYLTQGSRRHLDGYLAIPYDIPRGCAAGYMPEMNVLCAIGDYSTQSDQPLMKHVKVTVTPAS